MRNGGSGIFPFSPYHNRQPAQNYKGDDVFKHLIADDFTDIQTDKNSYHRTWQQPQDVFPFGMAVIVRNGKDISHAEHRKENARACSPPEDRGKYGDTEHSRAGNTGFRHAYGHRTKNYPSPLVCGEFKRLKQGDQIRKFSDNYMGFEG